GIIKRAPCLRFIFPTMKRTLARWSWRKLVIATGALLVSYGSHACFAADGNQLLNHCTAPRADAGDFRKGLCLGYIIGVTDASSEVCPPPGSDRGQGRDVVVRY